MLKIHFLKDLTNVFRMEEDGPEPRPMGFRGPSRQTPPQPQPPPPIDPMLDSKASQLENEIRQQNTSIKSVLDSLKHLEASQLPSMATTLQNLRTAIERIVVADIPNAIKPIEDDAVRVRQKFDKFSSETQGKLQNLREKLADTSMSISQLLSRYQDLSQTTSATVGDIDADLRRSKETLESASQRLGSLETGLTQADSILRNLKGEIQGLARAFNEKVAQFQNETTASFGATASQLNQELKTERAIRMQTVSQIDQQIREVHRNTTDAMTKMTQFLTSTKQQYQQALSSLSKSAKDGLTACNASVGEGFDQLADRMDQFVRDSNAQFESLEADITSTVQALSQHIMRSREGLEQAITNLSRARMNGETEIVARYDQLKTTLSQQLRQQAEHMENVCEAAVQAIMSHCEKAVAEIKAELSQVKAQIDRIGRLEIRLNQLNASVEQTRTQIVDQIRALGDKYAELLDSVERVDRDFGRRCEGIETRLAILEDDENRSNYATKTELEEVVARTRAMFDGRLQEIEQQIGQVHQNISDLMLNAGRRHRRPGGAGSALLSDLVKEQTH